MRVMDNRAALHGLQTGNFTCPAAGNRSQIDPSSSLQPITTATQLSGLVSSFIATTVMFCSLYSELV
jgi:hypothetical protein